MEENAFKEVAPILCLALSAISLAAAVHDTSDIHCSAADMNHSPTENKDLLPSLSKHSVHNQTPTLQGADGSPTRCQRAWST